MINDRQQTFITSKKHLVLRIYLGFSQGIKNKNMTDLIIKKLSLTTRIEKKQLKNERKSLQCG